MYRVIRRYRWLVLGLVGLLAAAYTATWDAGKETHILREPNGTVWVMQEYTRDVDPTLTIDNLKDIGPKLKTLPKGSAFETKVLEKDLVADTTKSDGWASIIRDDMHNTYQAMGYDCDTSDNYIP